MSLAIKDLDHSNVEDCVLFCHSIEGYSDWYADGYTEKWRKELEERIRERVAWARRALDEIGSCAKIAYKNGQVVGILWYFPADKIPYPDPDKNERVVFIQCMMVSREYRKMGIGSAFLQDLIGSCKKRHHFFHGEKPKAIEVYVYPPAKWPAGSRGLLEKHGFKVKRENISEMYESILLRHNFD
jgi:GNAT superfamily N-acetyltransferase